MYPKRFVLRFPTLVRLPGQEAVINRDPAFHDDARSSIPLYRLDWRDVDEAKIHAHTKWLKERKDLPVSKWVPFTPLTNPAWATRLDNLQFAVTDSYGEEIRRLTEMAMSEWDRSRLFDTLVKDACLAPAISMVQTAFFLLSDCIWDPEGRPVLISRGRPIPEEFVSLTHEPYWLRGTEKKTYEVALLIRFWDRQTSRGLVASQAGLNDLINPRPTLSADDSEAFRLRTDLHESFQEQWITREKYVEGILSNVDEDSAPEDPDEDAIREALARREADPTYGVAEHEGWVAQMSARKEKVMKKPSPT